MFGLNKAFRIASRTENHVEFCPINNMDMVMLDDLVGYEIQKKKLVDNTEAFVQGRKANNVLLFGDSGTGKSTSISSETCPMLLHRLKTAIIALLFIWMTFLLKSMKLNTSS